MEVWRGWFLSRGECGSSIVKTDDTQWSTLLTGVRECVCVCVLYKSAISFGVSRVDELTRGHPVPVIRITNKRKTANYEGWRRARPCFPGHLHVEREKKCTHGPTHSCLCRRKRIHDIISLFRGAIINRRTSGNEPGAMDTRVSATRYPWTRSELWRAFCLVACTSWLVVTMRPIFSYTVPHQPSGSLLGFRTPNVART